MNPPMTPAEKVLAMLHAAFDDEGEGDELSPEAQAKIAAIAGERQKSEGRSQNGGGGETQEYARQPSLLSRLKRRRGQPGEEGGGSSGASASGGCSA